MGSFREQQEIWENNYLFNLAKRNSEAKRWKEEYPDLYRTEYQRDIGRILYSDAFRRLRMKTQVFAATGADQHNRTRLTHSLEVAQIAKSIARPLKINVDLTEAIALGHDLGHTPYGHAGEFALNECLRRKSSFHHNVQSVWILRTTLCGRKDKFGELYPGFNLTHDVVEGIWKHTDYKETLGEIDGLENYNPTQPSSLEGQTVDIADGIAYLKHDVEDAIRNNILTYKEVEEIWQENSDFPFDFKNWSHFLIFDVISNSIEKNEIKLTQNVKILYKAIKKLVFEKVIKSPQVAQKDEEGKQKVSEIFNYCINNSDYVLSKFPQRNNYVFLKYGLERVIVDFIQWLGDENANIVYERIKNKQQFDSEFVGFYFSE